MDSNGRASLNRTKFVYSRTHKDCQFCPPVAVCGVNDYGEAYCYSKEKALSFAPSNCVCWANVWIGVALVIVAVGAVIYCGRRWISNTGTAAQPNPVSPDAAKGIAENP